MDPRPLPAAVLHPLLDDAGNNVLAATRIDSNVEAGAGGSCAAPVISQGCGGGLRAQWSSLLRSGLQLPTGDRRISPTGPSEQCVLGGFSTRRPSPTAKRRRQRFTTEGSTWPSAVKSAAALSQVAPDRRLVRPAMITLREYRKRGATLSSNAVTTFRQRRHRHRRCSTRCAPSNSRRRRTRRSCPLH